MSDGTASLTPLPQPLTGVVLRPWSAFALAAYCILLNIGLAMVVQLDVFSRSARFLAQVLGGMFAMPRNEGAAILVGVMAVGSYALVLLPTVMIARSRGVRFADAVGLRAFRPGPIAVGSLAVMASACCLVVPYSIAMSTLGVKTGNTDVLVRSLGGGPVGVTVLLIIGSVVAPFAEEVTFRGMVFASLSTRWRIGWAVVVSSLLFGLAHLDPVSILPTAAIGALLAFAFSRGRSLWVPIVAHGAYNGMVLLVALMLRRLG